MLIIMQICIEEEPQGEPLEIVDVNWNCHRNAVSACLCALCHACHQLYTCVDASLAQWTAKTINDQLIQVYDHTLYFMLCKDGCNILKSTVIHFTHNITCVT